MKTTTQPTQTTILTEKTEKNGFTFVYTLSHSILDSRDSYSITVKSYSKDFEDSASAEDISSKKETAIKLTQLLSKHTVSPCTLYDVLEDLL